MMDINQALMRRAKLTPIKRKRSAPSASQKPSPASSASTKTTSTMARRPATPLEEASQRSASASGLSSAPPSEAAQVTDTQAPQAAVPSKQAYLDLGQKGFGKHVTCRLCGLLYTAGEEEDEREHQRFCKQRRKGLTIAKWKNERVLRAFPDEDARIIEIRADDPPLHVKKMLEVKEVLDDALGFVSKETFLERGHFLFIKAKQIVGCVTVERIEKAVVLETDETTQGLVDVPAVLGVCQLWVHPKFRGKAIATRLVDVVREKFIYGLLIPKNRVAFAQPTRNGLAFATSYVAPHPVLGYEATTEDSDTAETAATSTTKRLRVGQ